MTPRQSAGASRRLIWPWAQCMLSPPAPPPLPCSDWRPACSRRRRCRRGSEPFADFLRPGATTCHRQGLQAALPTAHRGWESAQLSAHSVSHCRRRVDAQPEHFLHRIANICTVDQDLHPSSAAAGLVQHPVCISCMSSSTKPALPMMSRRVSLPLALTSSTTP